MAFGSQPFRGKRDQALYESSFAGKYQKLIKKNHFLYFGLPFMLSIVAGALYLQKFTSLKWERYDQKYRQVSEEEMMQMAENRRHFNKKDDYYRLQGLLKDTQPVDDDYEIVRIKRKKEDEPVCCEVCNDTVIKKKLDQHRGRCSGAYFTCIDCSTTFAGTDYKRHTQCITEAEKYEKSLYKGKKAEKEKGNKSAVRDANESKKHENRKTQEQEKKQKEEAPKSNQTVSKSTSESDRVIYEKITKVLKSHKKESLYKILKNLSKDDRKEQKKILKSLTLVKGDDGSVRII